MDKSELEGNSHAHSRVDDCRIVRLERFGSLEGTLCVVENGATSPLGYDVKRVYYLFDMPSDTSRGGHSHHSCIETLTAVAGSFEVRVSDGVRERVFVLRQPWECLLIPAGIWRTLENFSSGAVCLVMASEEFNESDYVRSPQEFATLTRQKCIEKM